MIEKGKQLTLSQRIRIEEMLNRRHRKFEIANELDKSQSTIAREINKHKKLKPHNVFRHDNMYNCKYFINCKNCTGKCKIFQPIPCKDRDRNIGSIPTLLNLCNFLEITPDTLFEPLLTTEKSTLDTSLTQYIQSISNEDKEILKKIIIHIDKSY